MGIPITVKTAFLLKCSHTYSIGSSWWLSSLLPVQVGQIRDGLWLATLTLSHTQLLVICACKTQAINIPLGDMCLQEASNQHSIGWYVPAIGKQPTFHWVICACKRQAINIPSSNMCLQEASNQHSIGWYDPATGKQSTFHQVICAYKRQAINTLVGNICLQEAINQHSIR